MFNFLAYKKRYGKQYEKYLQYFEKNENLSRQELEKIQKEKYKAFLKFSVSNSKFFKSSLSEIPGFDDLDNIKKLPILSKEVLRTNFEELLTVTDKKNAVLSKTGGTTGKSLKIYFTKDNMQERFAMLDNFRKKAGYELGKKTAWFSGKALLNGSDVSKNRFWKTDHFYKVRYYSTFHIKNDFLKYYVEDLIKYKPEFLVGFPSTILEIAKYGLKNNYDFPANTVKAVFPTAESLTEEMYVNIEGFFKTKMLNQYASSEGAPFIFECEQGNLHLELQSGIFEVLDDNNNDTDNGRLVLTSFTTYGTPLIRYDIGDVLEMEDREKYCICKNQNPLVKRILGRIDDYVYSPEIGKINLGNVSNTLKDTYGILKFQVVQDKLNEIDIYLIIDDEIYSESIEKVFLKNWRDRVGYKMEINLHYVNDILCESSGKFRIVKNNIKHLI